MRNRHSVERAAGTVRAARCTAELPKPSPPPLSGLSLTVVKLPLLRWCLTQNIHYAYLALAVALILAAMLA